MIQITATELVTSLILYSWVHGVMWVGKNSHKFLKTEYDHMVHRHIKDGHDDKLRHCEQDKCGKLVAAELATS